MYSKIFKRTFDSPKIMFWTMSGLALWPYNPESPVKFKSVHFLYSVVLFTWYIVQLPIPFIMSQNLSLSLPAVAIALQKIFESIIPVSVIALAFIDKGSCMKGVIDNVLYADQCLQNIGVEVSFTNTKKTVKVAFIIVTAYLSLLLLFNISVAFVTMGNLLHIPRLLPLFIIVHCSQVIYRVYFNYYFCIMIEYLKYRFQQLNEEVMSLKMSRIIGGINIISVQPYNSSNIKKIKTIKTVHGICRELTKTHNNRFSVAILLQFIQGTTVTTLSVYFTVCVVSQKTAFEVKNVVTVIVFLITMIQCFLPLACAMLVCSRTSAEANNMENVVHELMSETEDKDILQELEDFSLELIHGRVVFTACDFFTIDYSLFTMIVGAVASYVIIFLQFGSFDYEDMFKFVKNGTHSF